MMKPLSKKIRVLSLVITLVLFVIIGPLVLAYSVGYRFDDLSDSFAWIKTGGIYIHSDLSNTMVYRDGKFEKSGGFFLRNIFIQHLRTDKEYVFEVQKEGYHSWVKVLPVVESYVTEARTLMLPIEIEKIAIRPFIVENGVATSTEEDTNIINEEYLKQEILFGLATSTEDKILDAISEIIKKKPVDTGDSLSEEDNATSTIVSTIPKYFTDLGIENPDDLQNLITNNDEVAWIDNGNIHVYWIGREAKIPYYYCNLNICNNKLSIEWESEIQRFAFLPGRNDIVIILSDTGIWATELDNRSARNIQPIYLGTNLDFRINDNNRVVVLDDGVFYELRF